MRISPPARRSSTLQRSTSGISKQSEFVPSPRSYSTSSEEMLPYPYNKLPRERSSKLKHSLKKLESIHIQKVGGYKSNIRESFTLKQRINAARRMTI